MRADNVAGEGRRQLEIVLKPTTVFRALRKVITQRASSISDCFVIANLTRSLLPGGINLDRGRKV